MLKQLLTKTAKSKIAKALLILMLFQILSPIKSWALTSGPSQPEMQSFEPVGTTDLVDAFSGDFNYNIPLLDVEGYPINIAYHSGINMDQEASWVGLGWNINPGNISRNVRGIPDDFDGDLIEKTISTNPERTKRFNAFIGSSEIFGLNIPVNLSFGMNFSNYSGISSDIKAGFSIQKSFGSISTGINMGLGVSTDNGADFDYNVSLSRSSAVSKGVTRSMNANFGQQFNSRQGLMASTFGADISSSFKGETKIEQQVKSLPYNGMNFSHTPISQSNFVPVITNAAFTNSTFFQAKVGGELFGAYMSGGLSCGFSTTEFQSDGTRRSYGYLNLNKGNADDIMDFTRDRDGRFNRKMKYLPPASTTYDIFNVSGQGTAGNFRAFRTDIGSVFDPITSSENQQYSGRFEAGVGNLLELGADFTDATTHSSSRPWTSMASPKKYQQKIKGKKYEPYYFKQAGELTLSQMDQSSSNYSSGIGGKSLLTHFQLASIGSNGPISQDYRNPRSNLMYFFTGAEASNPNISLLPSIPNYKKAKSLERNYISRVGSPRKPNQISEMIQVLPDGRRYIYGIPAMNVEQTEYVASVDATSLYNANIEGTYNGTGTQFPTSAAGVEHLGQKFHMKSKTPAHAHTFLLTSVISPDYSDLTGNGISDDDLGNFTKFNYSLKDENYRWRAPYAKKSGRLDIGVRSDCHDDKATAVMGKKEIWMLHSIESRNYIAEFFISERVDGVGSDDDLITGPSKNASYKLDSIVLYNKAERYPNNQINANASAYPIKTVIFSYDYSLCAGIPNRNGSTDNIGKLTLKAIAIRSGRSDVGLLSPYKFDYGDKDYNDNSNPQINPSYDERCKDVWGEYKEQNANNLGGFLNMSNHEFPYVNQNNPNLNDNAYAWNLTKISLPSGGNIKVNYERDDYAYVQDKRAMEMFKVEGMGYSNEFSTGNHLYQSNTNPALYLYFKLKSPALYTGDLIKSYLEGVNSIQYNFEIKIDGSGAETPSCGIPLVDNVKGYADIEKDVSGQPIVGVCPGSSSHGYIKIKPKFADKTGALIASFSSGSNDDLILNPISVSAIHYAQYYNNKALNPASEIIEPNVGAILDALATSIKEYANYVRNPMIAHINKNLAKEFNVDRSYIRLQSQGMKKGGGHRVRRVEYSDEWNQLVSGNPVATYGSIYEYTTTNESGKEISSGVASYEPLLGGDENPLRNRVHSDVIGKKSTFPMTEPIEIVVEEPLGESLFPGASVGYSKVTIKSIHKADGASAQLVQVKEFYTARDFPVNVQSSDLNVLEDEYPAKINFDVIKEDIFRASQSYVITLNDMHGKQKSARTFIDKANTLVEVAHTYYNYFTGVDDVVTKKLTLKNEDIPCAVYNPTSNSFQSVNKELGVEVDCTFDTREKEERSRSWGLNINTNTLLFGIIPLPIPVPLPQIPKGSDKIFSSIVGTKVVQKYGILKSVETFDKGATVTLSNDLFDPISGQVLITSVNTEHKDKEYNLKTPAYWAYQGMGPAYENILYEEEISANASIVNDSMYFYATPQTIDNYKIGDELVVDIKNSCKTDDDPKSESYKLWVVGKTNGKTPNVVNSVISQCYGEETPCGYYRPSMSPENPPMAQYPTGSFSPPIYYQTHVRCFNDQGVENTSNLDNHHIYCTNVQAEKCWQEWFIQDPLLTTHNSSFPVERILTRALTVGTPNIPLSTTTEMYSAGQANHPNCNHQFATGFSQSGTVRYIDFKAKLEPTMANTPCPSPLNSSFATYSDFLSSPNIIKVKYLLKILPKAYTKNPALPFPTYPTSGGGSQNFPPNNEITARYWKFKCDEDNINIGNYLGSCSKFWSFGLNGTTTYEDENKYDWNEYIVYLPYNPSVPATSQHPLVTALVGSSPTTINYQHTNSNSFPSLPNLFIVDDFDLTRSVEVVTRDQAYQTYNNKSALICLPIKRGAKSTTGTNKPFPTQDSIINGNVKIIRSGGKNLLTENIQEMTALRNPVQSGELKFNYDKVLSIGATEYSDIGYLPEELNDPAVIYNNIYVTGGRGTYRPLKVYVYQNNRLYSVQLDKDKGIIDEVTPGGQVPSFWSLIPGLANVNYYRLHPVSNPNANKWYAKSTVMKYDSWGNDLEVKDASGAIHSNLFGYGHKVPIAVISNSESDNSLFENFEDYDPSFNQFIHNTESPTPYELKYYSSPIKKHILNNGGSGSISDLHHSGMKGFVPNGNDQPYLSIPIPFTNASSYSISGKPTVLPFHMRQQKYIFSYWQKVQQNTNSPLAGAVRIKLGGDNFTAKAKTPNIDGWVLYEGAVDATLFNGTIAELLMADGKAIDDLRILPNVSNMKAYVYHPTNRRLLAVLDENHMSTFFDYTSEGKLARIKKETEKGLLTLKESRESLLSIVQPTTPLIDLSKWFTPLNSQTYTGNYNYSTNPFPTYTGSANNSQ